MKNLMNEHKKQDSNLLETYFMVNNYSELINFFKPEKIPEEIKDDEQKLKHFKEKATIERSKKVKKLNDNIETMIKDICSSDKKFTYTQLRTIYAVVKNKKFESEQGFDDFYSVIPKLAYIEARQEKDISKKYVRFIRELANEVENITKYRYFIKIMEAIVAYHKLYS